MIRLSTLRAAALAALPLVALAGAVPAVQSAAAQPVERPALAPTPRFGAPAVERLALSNGLPVLVVARAGVPIVQIDLVVRAGSADDPAGKTGLAAFASQMMDDGAAGRSSLDLADAIDFLGITLRPTSGLHQSGVNLFTPVSKLAPALDLLADVALRPDFPEAEVERLRAQTAVGLEQRRDQPNAIASVLVNRTLFGADHPYGRTATPASVGALTRADLATFHRAQFQPGNAALVVVGDVSAATLLPMLEARFGQAAWAGGMAAPAVARVAEARQVSGRTVYLVDKPGAAQSAIRIGRIGAARSTTDYYALQVLNAILGGSFTSRLNQNLRETHGYAYGAGSSFAFRPTAGPFLASSNVQTDATAPSLTEFVTELTNIRTVPADELEKGKNFVALSFPGAFETVGGTASMIEDLWAFGLPLDSYAGYTDRILAVTSADLARVARQYIDPANAAYIVVGDRAKVEASVRALNLGTVRVMTIDDVFGPASR